MKVVICWSRHPHSILGIVQTEVRKTRFYSLCSCATFIKTSLCLSMPGFQQKVVWFLYTARKISAFWAGFTNAFSYLVVMGLKILRLFCDLCVFIEIL